MKKLIIAAAIVCAAVCANAAKVGWAAANMTNNKGDAYALFIIGQNDVTSIAQVEGLIKNGTDFSTYIFGKGTVANNGSAIVPGSTSGKTLDAGTYTSFMVLFDDAAMDDATKFVTISGISGQMQTIGATTAMATFAAGDVSGIVNDSTKWQAIPEPTSAMLLLLGVAGLALKRKCA